MIEARGLTKRYGAVVAVEDVSFAVQPREVVGLLGPNGAGKTTTMRMLTTFLEPDAGSALVAGHDTQRDALAVRRSIGYLPESAPLYHEMQVDEYLEFIARVRGIPGSQRAQKIRKMLEVCGLGSVRAREIGELSKGYRQRVGLAQALIHEPEVLILDEPTSGLDPNQIVEIRRLIKQLGEAHTVILSTHILSEVEATCSRVLIIDRGKVAASGTPHELASRAATGNHWIVVVRGTAADAVSKLRTARGVNDVVAEGANQDGLVRLRVTGSGDAELGEALFERAVSSGLTLSELRHETATLENVFRQLTQSGTESPSP